MQVLQPARTEDHGEDDKAPIDRICTSHGTSHRHPNYKGAITSCGFGSLTPSAMCAIVAVAEVHCSADSVSRHSVAAYAGQEGQEDLENSAQQRRR